MPTQSSTAASVPSGGEGKKGGGGKKRTKGRTRQQGDKPVNAPPVPSAIPSPKHAAPRLPIPTAAGERRGTSHGTVAKERAKADAILASTSSHWYAGAAFDRSPAASTLPKPTRLLSRSPTRMLPPQLATSCPSSSASSGHHYVAQDVGRPPLSASGAKTKPTNRPAPATSPGHEVQDKSRDLLSMLRSAQPAAAAALTPPDPAIAHVTPRKLSPPSAAVQQDDDSSGARQRQELDEMTRQVRRLLNIS